METIHGDLEATGDEILEDPFGLGKGCIDLPGVGLGRTPEYITCHQGTVAGMGDPDSQTPEITTSPECGDGVAQPIVPGMTAALLEANLADGMVELIVSNEDLLGRDGIEAGNRGDRLTAAVHVGRGFE